MIKIARMEIGYQYITDESKYAFSDIKNDRKVAKLLGLHIRRYRAILKKHGAKINSSNGSVFTMITSAKSALNELEPYIIAAKLRGEV